MARNSKWVPAPVEDVWAVLADARGYAFWVVGAHDIRGVDGVWPEPGATFHHTQGQGPIKLRDTSTVLEAQPPHRILLEVRVRPFVVAHVEIVLEPERDGTCITMVERMVGGMAGYVPQPLADPFLGLRNEDSLRRLAGMGWARAAALDHAPDPQGLDQDAEGSGTTPRSSASATNARA